MTKIGSENAMLQKEHPGNLVNPKQSVPPLKTASDKRVKDAQTPSAK